ncbi:hypothetical protein BKA70DRAFT_1272664 [Coprinopsis sp. MPI-PUGE-AT-0042]|nr:hypothetical protein BKA70DRAFT_1272664 [Coprinopsis sp. MPI-PUGE-AT-0042]
MRVNVGGGAPSARPLASDEIRSILFQKADRFRLAPINQSRTSDFCTCPIGLKAGPRSFQNHFCKDFLPGYQIFIDSPSPPMMLHVSVRRLFCRRPNAFSAMSTRIEIARRIDFPPYWPPKGVPGWVSKPLDPIPYTIRQNSQPSSFSVAEELHVGDNKWSQVYRGTFKMHGGTNSEGDLENVVLKIFDETKFPGDLDSVSKLPCGEDSLRLTGEIFSWQEGWAYDTLRELQGLLIPRFHGVYQVRAQDDRLLFAVSPVVRDVYTALYKMHQLGVADIDLRKGNLKYDPVNKSVVFYDFATARPSRYATEEEARVHYPKYGIYNDLSNSTVLLLDLGTDPEETRCYEASRRRQEFRAWALREYDESSSIRDQKFPLKKVQK